MVFTGVGYEGQKRANLCNYIISKISHALDLEKSRDNRRFPVVLIYVGNNQAAALYNIDPADTLAVIDDKFMGYEVIKVAKHDYLHVTIKEE